MFDINSWLRQQVGDPGLDVNASQLDVSHLQAADRREWLETNGLGSYASASISTANTRRYHGLLVASLNHPVQRTVMLSRIDETLTIDGGSAVELSTNVWASGAVAPLGYKRVTGFSVYPTPTWVFEVEGGTLIKQIAMVPGKDRVAIGYTWLSDSGKKAKLSFNLIDNYRDFHGETKGWEPWKFKQEVGEKRVTVRAFEAAKELVISFDRGSYKEAPCWYWGYDWPRETERGLNHNEDALRLGVLETGLEPGQSVTIVAEVGGQEKDEFSHIADFVKRSWNHKKELLEKAGNPSDAFVRQLVLAADQFLVERQSTKGMSVLAGYHWFNDWGRDSMISLPGLTLSTGRPEVAKSILETFGRYISEGMLPNNFPDSDETPHYNTVDATLWWAWSLDRYYKETGDMELVKKQLPLLDSVVEWHKKGTRHNIKLDSSDGLISAGDEGVQLTWMDAKVGDYVVTPRRGKPVEISALWYNLLKTLAALHVERAKDGSDGDCAWHTQRAADYESMADKTREGLKKFWNEKTGCLYDVINPDGTGDGSIRPNQLFALSLPHVAFDQIQAASIVKVAERELLTSYGMRTLSPSDPNYRGLYGSGKASANQYDRDITYHQGIAWPWLLGAWVEARLYAFGETADNVDTILKQVEPLMLHIFADAGVGSISEIFDGDAPYQAHGCVAQAWSVAELLRTRKKLVALKEKLAPQTVTVA